MERPLWLKPESLTQCALCGEQQQVAVSAVGYSCRACSTDWRWTACGNCDQIDVVREELPAVECSRCHTVHVSWWRTVESESIAASVAERRRRAEVAKRRLWRQWTLVLGALVGLSLLGLWIWVVTPRRGS